MNEISVSPEELRQFAEEIKACENTYRTSLSDSMTKVDTLRGVWEGPAAEAFLSSFEKLYNDCCEGILVLSNLSEALYDSADTYERSEKSIEEEASGLPQLPFNTMR